MPTTNTVVDNIIEIDMSGFVRLESSMPPSSSLNDAGERDDLDIDRSIESRI